GSSRRHRCRSRRFRSWSAVSADPPSGARRVSATGGSRSGWRRIAALREEARAVGREAAKIPVSIAMSLAAARAWRHALGTKPTEIIKNARTYAGLGVETLIISANTSESQEARAALEMITCDVVLALAS